MRFLRPRRGRVYVVAVALASLAAANAQAAFARDATIDVHDQRGDANLSRRVSKSYTVHFIGINPLRYRAELNVVVQPTPAPPPAKPGDARNAFAPAVLTEDAFASFKTTFETAAKAVDTDLAMDQWPALLHATKSTGGSPIAVATLTKEFRGFHTLLVALADTKPSADSPDGKLLAQASALDAALSPVINAPDTASSEISNQGSCSSGGGETDTLTRTPLVPTLTAATTLKTKVDVRCEQLLALTPGVVVGAIGSPTYEAVAPLGVTPAPAFVSVTERKATLQTKTVAQLHYRLTDIGESSALHLTMLGTLASTDSTGAFEGGLGLSFSTLEDRLFFTVGVLGTTKQFARADAGPGHQVAPNTQIPTVSSTLYPVVFGISFKL